jgi:hypothetical protein
MAARKGKSVAATTAWFAPDTNFFIQCKAPPELDWSAVTDAPTIVLLVVRTVVKEIDGHKQGGNQRRADRARATASIFGAMLDGGPGFEHVYRDSRPRVLMRFGPRLDPSRQKPEDFDGDQADDRIVEQVLATGAKFGHMVSLLTHDNGPRHTAGEFGVPCMKIPDAWLREPEQDPQAKRAAELERENRLLRMRLPEIVVMARQQESDVQVIRGGVDAEVAIPDSFIERMCRAVSARHPVKSHPDMGVYGENEWGDYLDSYDRWLIHLRERMTALAGLYNQTAPPVPFSLHFDNVGAATAESPKVEIAAEGPIRLVKAGARAKLMDITGRIFENPPKPPSGHYDPAARPFVRAAMPAILPPVTEPIPEQSDQFFWVYDEPGIRSSHCLGKCLELRHGVGGLLGRFLVAPSTGTSDAVVGALAITLSSPSLPTVFKTTIRVELTRSENGVQERIAAKLKDEFNLLPFNV